MKPTRKKFASFSPDGATVGLGCGVCVVLGVFVGFGEVVELVGGTIVEGVLCWLKSFHMSCPPFGAFPIRRQTMVDEARDVHSSSDLVQEHGKYTGVTSLIVHEISCDLHS